MTKLELSQIYLQMEHEINHLSHTTISLYRNAIKEDARETVLKFKNDIDQWVLQLNDREIACYDLEFLLEKKKTEVELARLEEVEVDDEELDEYKNDILRVMAKSIMNVYLNSLFRTEHSASPVGGVVESKWY
jgi:hypothetical protein